MRFKHRTSQFVENQSSFVPSLDSNRHNFLFQSQFVKSLDFEPSFTHRLDVKPDHRQRGPLLELRSALFLSFVDFLQLLGHLLLKLALIALEYLQVLYLLRLLTPSHLCIHLLLLIIFETRSARNLNDSVFSHEVLTARSLWLLCTDQLSQLFAHVLIPAHKSQPLLLPCNLCHR